MASNEDDFLCTLFIFILLQSRSLLIFWQGNSEYFRVEEKIFLLINNYFSRQNIITMLFF